MNCVTLNSKLPIKMTPDKNLKRRKQSKEYKCLKSPRDAQLLKRIRRIIGDNVPNTMDTDTIAKELMKFHPEYRRKKVRDFNCAVANTFLKEEEADGDSDFSDEKKDLVSYPDTNLVNKSISDMYKNSPKVAHAVKEVGKNGNIEAEAQEEKEEDIIPVKRMKKDVSVDKKSAPRKKHEMLLQESEVTFKNVGGIDKILEANKHHVFTKTLLIGNAPEYCGERTLTEEMWELLVQIRHPEVYEHLGVIPPRGFLLNGPPGSGKTLLAHAIAGVTAMSSSEGKVPGCCLPTDLHVLLEANIKVHPLLYLTQELQLPMLKVAATELVTGVSGESEEKIRELFDQAKANAPCVLFIDEIDAITPKRETAQREMERRIVSQLLFCLDELSQKTASTQLVIIGATNRADSLDPALRRAGRFDHEICLGIPDEEARIKILKVLCQNLKLSPNFDFQVLAHNCPGYVGADLMALTRKAATCAVRRVLDKTCFNVISEAVPTKESPTYSPWFAKLTEPSASIEDYLKEAFIEYEDYLVALKNTQPSAKREGFATVPDTTWDDVGALKNIREELQMAILAPVSHRSAFEAMGLTTSSGILLCGPPGCGKTLLAKAIANESGLNFISVKGPELLNMYVGESERAVRQCFHRARNAAPCVIFFDELDALCPRRTKDTAVSGSSDRVVNQLLTEMDGMDCRKQVFVLAATNRPDIIDPAIMRPGRLDKMLYVGLPPPEDRVDILRTVTKNGSKPPLDEDVNLESLGKDVQCEGFSGADLTALVREASSLAIKQALQNQNNSELHNLKVKNCHFEEALRKVRPSVSSQDQKLYEKMKARSSLTSSSVET